MTKFIITDLTLYGKYKNYVCIAMINIQTLECIRPLDRKSTAKPKFFSKQHIESINLKVSDVVEVIDGLFPISSLQKPHTEDHYLDSGFNIIKNDISIQDILEKTCSPNLKDGFGVPISGRAISITNPPDKSIITLKLPTENIVFCLNDMYDENSIRMNFSDLDTTLYCDVPIADSIIKKEPQTQKSVENFNNRLNKSKYVYLRVGLGREWNSSYWIQINTIKGTND